MASMCEALCSIPSTIGKKKKKVAAANKREKTERQSVKESGQI